MAASARCTKLVDHAQFNWRLNLNSDRPDSADFQGIILSMTQDATELLKKAPLATVQRDWKLRCVSFSHGTNLKPGWSRQDVAAHGLRRPGSVNSSCTPVRTNTFSNSLPSRSSWPMAMRYRSGVVLETAIMP